MAEPCFAPPLSWALADDPIRTLTDGIAYQGPLDTERTVPFSCHAANVTQTRAIFSSACFCSMGFAIGGQMEGQLQPINSASPPVQAQAPGGGNRGMVGAHCSRFDVRFYTQVGSFADNVYAAIIAFAFAFGYHQIIEAVTRETNPISIGSAVTRAWLCIMMIALVVDDWFGSRRMMAYIHEDRIGKNRAMLRFSVDVGLAILAYPLIMAGAGGLRISMVLAALYMLGGAAWSLFCWRGVDRATEDNVYQHLASVSITHVACGACVFVVAWSLWYSRLSDVFRPFSDSGLKLGLFILGFVLTVRFGFKKLWALSQGKSVLEVTLQ
jgi:hypothetical protein